MSLAFTRLSPTPVVQTLHHAPRPSEVALWQRYPEAPFIAISREQARLLAGLNVAIGRSATASATYTSFDASEATYVTRESVKAINRMEDRLDDTFSVLRQVNLNCAIGEIRWHGSRERVENFSFFDTLGAIAKSDAQAEGALALTTEIQDKPTRIRAQVAIVKAVIK